MNIAVTSVAALLRMAYTCDSHDLMVKGLHVVEPALIGVPMGPAAWSISNFPRTVLLEGNNSLPRHKSLSEVIELIPSQDTPYSGL